MTGLNSNLSKIINNMFESSFEELRIDDADSRQKSDVNTSILSSKIESGVQGGSLIPNRIFVGGIATSVTEWDLRSRFMSYGTVKSVKIIRDHLGISKGYGFITFSTKDEAKRALEKTEMIFKGRKLNIAPAIRKQVLYSHVLRSSSMEMGTGFVLRGVRGNCDHLVVKRAFKGAQRNFIQKYVLNMLFECQFISDDRPQSYRSETQPLSEAYAESYSGSSSADQDNSRKCNMVYSQIQEYPGFVGVDVANNSYDNLNPNNEGGINATDLQCAFGNAQVNILPYPTLVYLPQQAFQCPGASVPYPFTSTIPEIIQFLPAPICCLNESNG
ncbi:protein boule-like [Nephila pilipes]|uniref:Protein boule-like n=1 Tax=Nephila pilipes TaxID=299642 RepID=A0A8X6NM95_NEPPI|nr:protein boule-like [Nephila pilipes]